MHFLSRQGCTERTRLLYIIELTQSSDPDDLPRIADPRSALCGRPNSLVSLRLPLDVCR